MEWSSVKDQLLTGLVVLMGGYVATQMKELVRSINELNIRIAEIVERVAAHKETLEEHATRIQNLEDNT